MNYNIAGENLVHGGGFGYCAIWWSVISLISFPEVVYTWSTLTERKCERNASAIDIVGTMQGSSNISDPSTFKDWRAGKCSVDNEYKPGSKSHHKHFAIQNMP